MKAIKNITYLPPEVSNKSVVKEGQYPVLTLSLLRLGFSTFGRIFPTAVSKLAYQLFSTPRARAKHKVSDTILEKARIFELLYGGQILKAYEWGSGENVILLVHGWESRGTALRSFVPDLLKKGYRVVAFDGPAHGDSGGKRTNLPHFAGAVRAMINHIGGVYGIVTHSFGGAAAVFALWQIDAQIEVEKLVLIAVPNRMTHALKKAEQLMGLPKIVTSKFMSILESKINLPLSEVDIAKANGKIQVKEALVVHDKMDTVLPLSESEIIFNAWDNASLLVSEGYGHYKLVKQPEVITKIVHFIAQ